MAGAVAQAGAAAAAARVAEEARVVPKARARSCWYGMPNRPGSRHGRQLSPSHSQLIRIETRPHCTPCTTPSRPSVDLRAPCRSRILGVWLHATNSACPFLLRCRGASQSCPPRRRQHLRLRGRGTASALPSSELGHAAAITHTVATPSIACLHIHLRTAAVRASRPAPRHVRLIACAAHSTGLTLTRSTCTCIYPFSFTVILHNGPRGRPQLLLRLQRRQAAFDSGRLMEPRPATPYPPACAGSSPISNTTVTYSTNTDAADTATVRIRRRGA